jgi:hypothetical protein
LQEATSSGGADGNHAIQQVELVLPERAANQLPMRSPLARSASCANLIYKIQTRMRNKSLVTGDRLESVTAVAETSAGGVAVGTYVDLTSGAAISKSKSQQTGGFKAGLARSEAQNLAATF